MNRKDPPVFLVLFGSFLVYDNFMKYKLLFLGLFIAVTPSVFAYEINPMFGDFNNQIGIYGGYAVGATAPERFNGYGLVQYSQPMSIFRLPGRRNIHAGYVNSRSDPWYMAGGSLDVALVSSNRTWFGVGVGVNYRNTDTAGMNSRLIFGERVFIGYRLADNFNLEIYAQHYSNGDLSEKNKGYNFIGFAGFVNF